MVVLEGGGGVVTIGNNQYLQPDYLAPLPTTMDAKKSPLALLAQTCSQIGADSSAVKPLLGMDKNKKSGTCSSSSTSSSSSSSAEISAAKSPSSQAKSPKSSTPITTSSSISSTSLSSSGSEVKLAFKPYETNVLSQQNQNSFKSSHSEEPVRPSSKNSSSQERVPSRSKSNATPTDLAQLKAEGMSTTPHDNSSASGSRKTVSPAGSSQRGASPIVRSGMEVLNNANGTAQHPKEMSSMAAAAAAAAAAYKAAGPYGLNPLSALCCPPGMEQHANPAFRPPFAGGFTAHHHAAMLAAAAANGGYPPAAAGPGAAGQPNPYISYQRIKTPAGGEAIVPVCKDPYCPGCPYSAHTQQMLMGAPCPAGCTQCEHQKYGMAMASAGLPPAHPYSQAAAAAAANAAAARSAPYVCSWVVGDAYCGKRFQTSDELFTHLRTHTGNLSDPAAAAAALAQSQAQSLLGTLFPPSALRAGYPTPPLSPMSAAAAAARYHPYGKPPGALAAAPSPFGAAGAFNPAAAAAAAALGPYYSPYAMYGQRMGAAHQ
ncbi:hypothetical protein KR215_011490 [Drosophila sulfurigaster]|uniref:zinc finger protein Noc n=1 Tax=Drosophila sulfurigaster albostrigata TaxID=89887 RepID=UPI002D21CAC9|nr:zinc finger protein Noc [Drosophila sulfurigaster albostrigata]KAH8395514.1 hypothetical protein KR215_011490 [Drosophila sulfurigaster]